MLGRALAALFVWVAARRWAVGMLVGLACVSGGRYLRTNAKDLATDVVTTTLPGGPTLVFEKRPEAHPAVEKHKVVDPNRVESVREDGLCLIVFGLAASALSLAAWLWQPPQSAAVPQPPPPPASDY